MGLCVNRDMHVRISTKRASHWPSYLGPFLPMINMQALFRAAAKQLSTVRYVLTDMDETLTYRGRLSDQTYAGLARLEAHGVRVEPVTAAPARWCDQMARMWPVDGVIAENGGLFLLRGSDGHQVSWPGASVVRYSAGCRAPW